MSKAIECDRCHKCFSPEKLAEGEVFLTLPIFYDQDQPSYEKDVRRAVYENYNLCPICTEQFYAFMNRMKGI